MKPFLSLFQNLEPLNPPPIWLMRQAGRYLPEYRQARQQAGDFLSLCYNPELACEVTLQPIRRFHFEAAILFADILLIPQALGQKLWFKTGEGPRLAPLQNANDLSLDNVLTHLRPIFQTITNLRHALPQETGLIGFAGAPWTVLTYMIAGRGTKAQEPAHQLMKTDELAFAVLMDIVIEATILYLQKQIEHGAEVLQIFDSWAGSLAGDDLQKWCIAPHQRIIQGLRDKGVTAPIIGFPRGIGKDIIDFVNQVDIQAISIDQHNNLEWVCEHLPSHIISQGNLDPLILINGGDELREAVQHILNVTQNRRHIFNLGHGIQPQTPPEHVSELIRLIRRE